MPASPPSSALHVRIADVREGEKWRPRQRLKNDLIHLAVRAALGIVERMPRRWVERLCGLLGATAYLLLGSGRAAVRARLRAGLGHDVASRCVRSAFRAAGATLADTLALLDPAESAARTLAIDPRSREVFRAALAEGRGVVFVSAHFGPWERMAALLVEDGFPVATVARESYDPRLTSLYDRLRAPRGVRSIYRGRPGAAMAIVRELRAGRAVGFLIDISARVRSVPERLFGAETDIPLGPARIARARGAAVVVGTCMPAHPEDVERAVTRGTVALPRVQIERVRTDDLPPGDAGDRALVRRLARILEARIASSPEWWLGLFAMPRAGS